MSARKLLEWPCVRLAAVRGAKWHLVKLADDGESEGVETQCGADVKRKELTAGTRYSVEDMCEKCKQIVLGKV